MADSFRAAHASVAVYNYPGTGHLFTDASLPKEYDAEACELLWQRVIGFCTDPTSSVDPT